MDYKESLIGLWILVVYFCGKGRTQVTEVDKGFLLILDNIKCTNEHGPQVGSLGQTPNRLCSVKVNIFINNNEHADSLNQLYAIIN